MKLDMVEIVPFSTIAFSTKSMKISSSKCIIFPLIISLHFLCMPKMCTSNKCCKNMSCKSKSSLYGGSISIESPFRLKDHQPESCGCPGFGLFCDDKQGLLLELPNAGNLTVSSINTYNSSREIVLSDPNDCLPQKLLSLDLNKTPFRRIGGKSKEFWVYNCSGVGHDHGLLEFEEIECLLKGSNDTIVSVMAGKTVTNSNCRLLKKVFVPMNYASFLHYSRLHLTWDEQDCELCGSSTTKRIIYTIIFLLIVMMLVLLFIFVVGWWIPQLSKRYYERASRVTSRTTRDTNRVVVSHTQSSTPPTTPPSAHGLDQDTINSYPTVVIGKSGRLIKPDDDKCSICLSDYMPGDTLKILPECLHRYHVNCIDLWLISKANCPICRTSPHIS